MIVVERILNCQIIRRERGYTTQFLVRWPGFGPEYEKHLTEVLDLVQEYNEEISSSNDHALAEQPDSTEPDESEDRQDMRPGDYRILDYDPEEAKEFVQHVRAMKRYLNC